MLKKTIRIMLKFTFAITLAIISGNIFGHFIMVENNNFYQIKETTVIYLNSKQANDYLEKTNYFTEQNLLSISLKTKGQINNDHIKTAQNEYQKYISDNLLEWKGSDKKYINKRFNNLLPYIKKYTNAVLVDTIFLIKSNKNIEFSSPFTKGKAIVIPESDIPSFVTSWLNKNFFEQTLAHELFHIYSSNNLKHREELYSLIGFEKIKNFYLSNELKKMQIINPDDNISDYFKISLKNPEDNEKQDFIVLILSKYPKYEGYKGLLSRINLLLEYSEIKLARIIKSNNAWSVKIKNGNPELYFKNEIPEYWEKIKLVHNITMTPEETLAEDYAILIATKINKKKLNNISLIGKEFLNNFELILK